MAATLVTCALQLYTHEQCSLAEEGGLGRDRRDLWVSRSLMLGVRPSPRT